MFDALGEAGAGGRVEFVVVEAFERALAAEEAGLREGEEAPEIEEAVFDGRTGGCAPPCGRGFTPATFIGPAGAAERGRLCLLLRWKPRRTARFMGPTLQLLRWWVVLTLAATVIHSWSCFSTGVPRFAPDCSSSTARFCWPLACRRGRAGCGRRSSALQWE